MLPSNARPVFADQAPPCVPLAVAKIAMVIFVFTVSLTPTPASGQTTAEKDAASATADGSELVSKQASSNPAPSSNLAPPKTYDRDLVKQLQQRRISAVNRVIDSVIAIYDDDRQGGGSGVVITPSGIALTNHHVIIGAGIKGWGGMAGDKMYRWKLIGTDPGGDVSLIQMLPDQSDPDMKFPYTPLGDSDLVQVGDWAIAMGNPFILTEDQSPTVTMGIVSGVKRYQSGAGKNELVYGNCIQVDSSINPGNSGGPLFNLNGEVIGINGRGSFQDRGRVNVGLGYAISANQIRNFIPDLLATKLVEHGTLDSNFSDRGGKVVCSTIDYDSPAAKAGLELNDELLEFENIPIETANQFTNIICTLPEDWPATLLIRKPSGEKRKISVRLFGLPYAKPPVPRNPAKGRGDKPSAEEQRQRQRQLDMVRLLAAPAGTIRHPNINLRYTQQLIEHWKSELNRIAPAGEIESGSGKDRSGKKLACVAVYDRIESFGDVNDAHDTANINSVTTWVCSDGRFRIATYSSDDHSGEPVAEYIFDGGRFFGRHVGNLEDGKKPWKDITPTAAKVNLFVLHAIALTAGYSSEPFSAFGQTRLDGSGKANFDNAYRFRTADDDEDPLYWWTSLNTPAGLTGQQLVKVSPDLDCRNRDGGSGLVLGDWQNMAGIALPMQKQFVKGLDETITHRFIHVQHESISLSDFDRKLAVGTSGKSSENVSGQ